MCPLEDLKKRLFYCSQCNNSFAKSSCLVRHQKRVHSSKGTVNTPETSSSVMTAFDITESDSAQEWSEDPGELIYEPELESEWIIRKKSSPFLHGFKRKAPNKEMSNEPSVNELTAKSQKGTFDSIPLYLLQDSSYYK